MSSANILHFFSRSKRGSRNPVVAVEESSQDVKDARSSAKEVDDGLDLDMINPGELTFEEGTFLKF